MNKKIISAFVIGIIIVVIGSVVYTQQRNIESNTTQTPLSQGQNTNTTGTTGSTQNSTYTMADVATHSGQASCWTVIDGAVYDLTSWVSRHPGGEQGILELCGKNGTQAFRDQHDHNQKQENILATMKIGILAQ